MEKNKDKVKNAHDKYRSGKIDAYELADLLSLEYTQIGAYIMTRGLHMKKVGKK
jgi:hypothetical protein